ncbi:hypothetical protein TNCV_1587761 [Trichonephila clavipes]|uniref:Uncharacterized protein n=1 Tax=Trichonephila clavipes TaxID=2585209 RepID=A0A8X6V575_TRICX|nr:hypothetical protein TNCV_1587761 [Trichonephila clavipes]
MTEKILRIRVCTSFFRLFRCKVHVELNHYEKNAPTNKSIPRCYHQFKKNLTVWVKKSSDRPSVSEEAMQRVRQSFVRSPRKCTRVAVRELAPENRMENFTKNIKFQAVSVAIDTTNDREFVQQNEAFAE